MRSALLLLVVVAAASAQRPMQPTQRYAQPPYRSVAPAQDRLFLDTLEPIGWKVGGRRLGSWGIYGCNLFPTIFNLIRLYNVCLKQC